MLKPIDILLASIMMTLSSVLIYGKLYDHDAATVVLVAVSGIGGFLYAYVIQLLRNSDKEDQ